MQQTRLVTGARQVALWSAALAVISIVGCNRGDRPKLGTVEGVVTIDGQPLAGAVVMFQPDGRRSSRGFTNDHGEYELGYLRDIRGAAVGEHRVIIDRVPQNDGKQYQRLPPKYNVESELTAVVEPGSNKLNWDLASRS